MVRVRYAPSPTGSPHVGNIRTALFNYLMARKHGGVFIVRIEDTDQTRQVDDALDDILESLRWLGITWDEGPEVEGPYAPYFQSQRLKIYKQVCEELIKKGSAYRCFCTPEDLEKMREYQRINKLPQMYDRRCRKKTVNEAGNLVSKGIPYVIRLAMPLEGKIVFEDAIRGRVEYESSLVDDQVLLKSDGWPTYHLANVVDDYLMKVSHVIRGEEWISSTPKHVVLYDAMGWEKPTFVHAPVIKGPDGAKLSKRHGDTRCLDYREKGYLSEAVANFIALIGWSPGGDRELMTLKEMEDLFSIEGIQPSAGVFDITKLQWMNGHYIRQLTPEKLYETVKEFHEKTKDEDYRKLQSQEILTKAFEKYPKEYLVRAFVLEQERVKLLSEFADACLFFFVDEVEIDKQAGEKWLSADYVPQLLDVLMEQCEKQQDLNHDVCESMISVAVEKLGLEKRSMAIHPTRVALTGRTFGPSLFDLMALLGVEQMKKRFAKAKLFAESLLSKSS